VLTRLGPGGIGQVYLGRARDGTLVAVKVVRADVAAESPGYLSPEQVTS
jgi:predicted unusual protein kinase regulating ubiquinone biosynthesis (AarF/ABC1/UbiB family)